MISSPTLRNGLGLVTTLPSASSAPGCSSMMATPLLTRVARAQQSFARGAETSSRNV